MLIYEPISEHVELHGGRDEGDARIMQTEDDWKHAEVGADRQHYADTCKQLKTGHITHGLKLHNIN